MAFKGRGSLKGGNSSISRSINAKKNGASYNINHVHVRVYKDYSEYLFCQSISLVVISVIILISILILVFSYESSYIYDPLAEMKNTFLDIKFLGIIIGIILTIISISKLKTRNAFKFIIFTLMCLLIPVLMSGYMLITLESEYNDIKLAEMYTESYLKLDVVGDAQSFFVSECQKLNEQFKIKVITICIMEYVMIFVNFFLLFSELRMKKKYDQIEKENEVLFDEEINVKI